MITQNISFTPERYEELVRIKREGIVLNALYPAPTGSSDEGLYVPRKVVDVEMYGRDQIRITYELYDRNT